jgi:hypothetical protein
MQKIIKMSVLPIKLAIHFGLISRYSIHVVCRYENCQVVIYKPETITINFLALIGISNFSRALWVGIRRLLPQEFYDEILHGQVSQNFVLTEVLYH